MLIERDDESFADARGAQWFGGGPLLVSIKPQATVKCVP